MIVSFAELSALLIQRNHQLLDVDESGEHPTNVWPSRELIVTVAMEEDGTLRPEYRSNYFTCNPNGLLEGGTVETQAVVGRLISNACRRSDLWGDEFEFLSGPVRWFLLQCLALEEVHLWPGRYRGSSTKEAWKIDEWELEGARAEWRAFLETNRYVLDGVPAQLILSISSDLNSLLEAAMFVAESCHNIYVADNELQTVYLLHHHNKIVLSYSDLKVQQDVTRDLRFQTTFFEDHSHFHCESDAELFSEPE